MFFYMNKFEFWTWFEGGYGTGTPGPGKGGGGGDSTSSYPGCVGLRFRYVPILQYSSSNIKEEGRLGLGGKGSSYFLD